MRRGLVAAAALALVGWWALRPFRVDVQGQSMEPELMPGDYLVAIRSGSLRRGALVVVEHPDRPGFEVVKRLTGLPGDPIGDSSLSASQHWVQGDNRAASSDSRTFGPVASNAIKGVIRVRYWPPGRVRLFG
jgi:signal peptidase I